MKRRARLNYILGKTILRRRVDEKKKQFAENLVVLHDALQQSDVADHYWIWGGLLLGWAREGQILDHDYRDADFAFFSEDRERFLQSIGRIVQAGFQPLARWVNNDNETTEYTFVKDNARFDFFEMRRQGDSVWFHTYSPAAALQTLNAIPNHGLQTVEFLGRTWLKPSDHDSYLRSVYGNWRQADPTWDWLEDDNSIREMKRWVGSAHPIAWTPTTSRDTPQSSDPVA